MPSPSLLIGLLLGIGLAASTGLNTFVPLLLLSAAARFHIAGIALGEKFEWLSSDLAIGVLIVASIVEIVADKIPAVDHFLDSVGTFVRPVAGAVAAASVLTDVDPAVAARRGIAVGAPASLGLHTLKAGTRLTSSAATLGCANPVLSLIEDVASLSLSLLSIFVPLAVPVALLLGGLARWWVVRRVRRPRPTAPAG